MIENTRLEMVYFPSQDEVYIGSSSLFNFLLVFQVELMQGEATSRFANLVEELNNSISNAAKEVRKEFKDDSV